MRLLSSGRRIRDVFLPGIVCTSKPSFPVHFLRAREEGGIGRITVSGRASMFSLLDVQACSSGCHGKRLDSA